MKKAGALAVIIISMLIIIVTVPLFADQTVITEDGKKILLKEDKIWEYLMPSPTSEIGSGFRRATWGMSMTEVSTLESAKRLSQNNDMLSYAGVVNNLDCLILYIFDQGKLVQGKYIIIVQHKNKNDYISDYNNLKQMLTKKYGPPSSDKQYWRSDLHKNNYEEWGSAVSLGDLAYYSEWQTPATDIALRLFGDNYVICLVLEYQSVASKNLEEKIIKNYNLQKLQSFKWIQ